MEQIKTDRYIGPGSLVRTVMYECVYDCGQLQCTIQQKTVPIIFYLIFQTMITAQMLSTEGQQDLSAGSAAKEPCCTIGSPTMQCYSLVPLVAIVICQGWLDICCRYISLIFVRKYQIYSIFSIFIFFKNFLM